MVEITQQEYERLLEAEEFLNCLETAGVDNWEGYDTALMLLRNEIGEDDI
jgi:hypothetical protein